MKDIKDEISKQLPTVSFFENSIEELRRKTRNYIDIAMKQTESFISVSNYLNFDKKPLDYHSWPISPDISLLIVNLFLKNRYQYALEFGSGTSTVLMSTILKRFSSEGYINSMLYSIEHESKYYNETKRIMLLKNTEEFVNLKLCPLKPMKFQNTIFKYYSCEKVLKKLSNNCKKNNVEKIFVLVDGPPSSVSKNSRYPAVPLLVKFFINIVMHILLDDFNREDEKGIFDLWVEELNSSNINIEYEEYKFEKGAVLLKLKLNKGENK